MINGNIQPLHPADAAAVADRGGTMLKTSRSTEFMEQAGRDKVMQMLKEHQIEGTILY